MRILLCENFALTLNQTKRILLTCLPDIVIETALSAEAALEMVQTGDEFDLIITDIHMDTGNMTGIAFITALATLQGTAVIVAMSADDGHRDAAIDAGASVFLPKKHGLVKALVDLVKRIAA